MKKTLIIFVLFLAAFFPCKAQDFTFDGVSMMQPVEQFKEALEAKGHTVFSEISRSYLLEGKFLGRKTNFFSVQGYKDYVNEVNVAYSFVTLKEAQAFRKNAIKQLEKMYPDFNSSIDDTYCNIEGQNGSISIYWGSKEEFAGGDGIYPKKHKYVVSIYFQPKIKKKAK